MPQSRERVRNTTFVGLPHRFPSKKVRSSTEKKGDHSTLTVSIVSSYPPSPDRGSVSTSWFARSLAATGARVSVMTEVVKGLPRKSQVENVVVSRILGPNLFSSLIRVFRDKQTRQSRIVHIIFGYAFFRGPVYSILMTVALLVFCRIAHKRSVLSIHQVFDPRTLSSRRLREFGVKVPASLVAVSMRISTVVLCRLPSCVIALHPDDHGTLLRVFGARNVKPVPIGVRVLPGSKQQAKRSLGLEGRKVLLAFGFLAPYKGIDYALKALPAILSRIPNAVLLIAGSNLPRLAKVPRQEQYIPTLTSLAQSLGIENNVLFDFSFVEPEMVGTYFHASDILLLPYMAQTGPSEVLRMGFAYQIPPIAFDTEYMKKDISQRMTGLLVRQGDTIGLANSAVELFTKPALHDSIIHNIERIWHDFTVEKQVERTIDLYRELLSP